MHNNFIKKALVKYLFPYGSTRIILRGVCRGMRVRVSRESGHSILWDYERISQKFLKYKIKKGMTIYDIGANIGQYALFFSKLVGPLGQVISCEPNKKVFDNLISNIQLNKLKNVNCQNVALGSKRSQAYLSTNPDSLNTGKISNVEPTYDIHETEKILVNITTLDDLSANGCFPNIIKIDTEGSAAAILQGGSETIRKHHPSFYIELHGPEEQTAVQDLANFGYKLQSLDETEILDMMQWDPPVWAVWRNK